MICLRKGVKHKMHVHEEENRLAAWRKSLDKPMIQSHYNKLDVFRDISQYVLRKTYLNNFVSLQDI